MFYVADHAMYLLGPILIALASAIIGGLTYLFVCILLPMMTGTNWIVTTADYHAYRNGGGPTTAAAENEQSMTIPILQSILVALATPTGIFHTLIVSFFLTNVIYNYYQCVTTSNSGKVYDVVVRELAQVTNFDYPETEEELIQCKRGLERKIAAKLESRRRELMAAANNPQNHSTNGDEETANNNNNTTNSHPQPIPPPPRIHNWQLLSPTEWSYCRFSKQPKPPRSHYDHVTKSLVLNMDHYCPWMFNCVGYFNYRYFLNFLVFTTTGLFYGAVICWIPFRNCSGKAYREQIQASSRALTTTATSTTKAAALTTVRHLESNPYIPTPNERTPVALGFMMCLCLCCAVGCLLGFHLYLTFSAQTTIEFHGNWAKRRKKKKGGWKNPYSAGNWKRNWEMIYGTRYHFFFQRGGGVAGSGSSSSADDENGGGGGADVTMQDQYSYRGCWGMFMAMMPSKREPEFLPFPINNILIRRKTGVNCCIEVDKKVDEEVTEVESCPGLHLSVDHGDGDDVIGVFKKKSPSRTATALTERSGRNTSRGEELIV